MLDIGMNVLWVSFCSYLPGDTCQPAPRREYHCIYIVRGTGLLTIDGQEHIAQENQVYLIPKGHLYCYSLEKKMMLETIELKFEVDNGFLMEKMEALNSCIKLEDVELRMAFESLTAENLLKRAYYKDIINLKFLGILMRLLRPPKEKSMQPRKRKSTAGLLRA